MAHLTSNTSAILRPEEVHDLVVQPLTQESVAFQVSTVAQIGSTEYRLPVVTGDPDTSWVAEGAEIPVDDAEFGEVVVTPRNVAGLTVVSNQLAEDSDPAATAVIGDRLVQSLRRKIDTAFFAAATTNGPSGLGAIAPTQVYAGTAFGNLDPFLEAQVAAEKAGAKLTSFVAHPDTVLALARVKKATGSNEPLLQSDAASPSGRVIAGTPLITSPDAPVNVVWGIPKALSFVVLRKDVELAVDSSVFFTSHRTAIKALARVTFAWPHSAAVVKINRTAAP